MMFTMTMVQVSITVGMDREVQGLAFANPVAYDWNLVSLRLQVLKTFR